MKAVIFAWVLLFNPGSNWSFTVSGIGSEQECHRLGDKLGDRGWLGHTGYECERYETVGK